MDDLIFPVHARAEMRADSLTEDDVWTVIGDYDEMLDRQDGRTEYARRLDDGRYVVVVVEEDRVTVVTVWWDKRRSRRPRR
jgi:Txe/YoeB family toxin of Txe-Axe toxin-antitoxin module